MTGDIIGEYIPDSRAKEVDRGRQKNPGCIIIDNLLIYANELKRTLHAYKKGAIDKHLFKLEKKAGSYISNHDLRRTYGRGMHFACVKTERIATILEYSDTRATMKYLGLDPIEMKDDMSRYFALQNTLPQKWGNIEKASEMNGQGGLHPPLF
ncbi:MAG TPA: hypothetical protein VMW85_03465 [Methanomassiliicoccales archaeon]|nr:hypothetical protein [Methanomassiliicoccales archaeon]